MANAAAATLGCPVGANVTIVRQKGSEGGHRLQSSFVTPWHMLPEMVAVREMRCKSTVLHGREDALSEGCDRRRSTPVRKLPEHRISCGRMQWNGERLTGCTLMPVPSPIVEFCTQMVMMMSSLADPCSFISGQPTLFPTVESFSSVPLVALRP